MSVTLRYPNGHESVVTLPPEAVERGAEDYFAGASARDNPYPIPGRKAWGWDVGFQATAQEVEGSGGEEFLELGGEG